FGDHHRAMLPTRAAERDRQIALTLLDVVRQEINQKLRNARDELLRLRKRADVLGDPGVASGKRPEFRDKMRVRQEADVENEVCIFGHAMAKAEADAGDEDVLI